MMFNLLFRNLSPFSTKHNFKKYIAVRQMVQQHDFINLKKFVLDDANKQQVFMRELISLKSEWKENQQLFNKISKTNIYYQSLSLQLLAIYQQKISKKLIEQSQYHFLLNHYYAKIERNKDKNFLFVDRFIHTENRELMDYVKRNQVKIVEGLVQKQGVKPHLFERVIGTQLFNITDLPMLLQTFYQVYFPSLKALSSLKQVQSSLIYLAQFSKMPYFLPKVIHELIEQKVVKNSELTFQQFAEINNILLILTYNFRQSLQATGMITPFQKLHKQMLDKMLAKSGQKQNLSASESIVKVIQKQNQKRWSEILEERKSILEQYAQNASQILQVRQNNCLDEALKINLKQIQQNMSNNAQHLQQKTQIQSKLAQLKQILLSSSNQFQQSDILYHYLKHSSSKQFITNNILLPNLYKYLNQTMKIIEGKVTWKKSKQSTNVEQFLLHISKNIDSSVRNVVNSISKSNIDVLIENNRQELLNVENSSVFQHILCQDDKIEKLLNFHFEPSNTLTNVLTLLKNDPEYLIRLIKCSNYSFLTNTTILKQHFKVSQNTYSQGLGFKLTQHQKSTNQRPETAKKFKLKTQLLQNFNSSRRDSTPKPQYLKGSLRSMLISIKNSPSRPKQ